jgi:hypothetical protein
VGYLVSHNPIGLHGLLLRRKPTEGKRFETFTEMNFGLWVIAGGYRRFEDFQGGRYFPNNVENHSEVYATSYPTRGEREQREDS